LSDKTSNQFDKIIALSKAIFLSKAKDYGTSWRILRPASLTDQLYIKAKRIRSIEEKGSQQVGDSVEDDYIGLINYSVMALIQLCEKNLSLELTINDCQALYDKYMYITKELMIKKNHDYGEVWRDMRVESITDLILQKLLRVKQIEDNKGKTTISEGLEANYQDIINYAVFAMIRIQELNQKI
jgi:hypothetical protein